ncbi:MAG: Hsp20/alpha crystallin family protein [Bacteroidota bacterium]|nr:Hsp20/alpha crystallin family protein [Bacteroidota bacterium]
MIDVKENVETKVVEPDFENEVLITPLVNIYETENDFTLVADMPGVSKSNINIKYEDSFLTIYGRVENTNINKKYVLKETSCGNYFRKFKLSNSIDSDKIEASMENGQLSVLLPKNDRVKAKTISIK